MKAADQIKSRSTDRVQLYGAFVGGEDPGCQDYAKAISLNGVRIVDAKWLEALATAHDDLLEALTEVIAEADSYTARTGKPVYNWLDKARAAIAKAKGLTK